MYLLEEQEYSQRSVYLLEEQVENLLEEQEYSQQSVYLLEEQVENLLEEQEIATLQSRIYRC